MDPKVKNLIKFFATNLTILFLLIWASFKYVESDPLRWFGGLIALILLWRISLSIYRRCIVPAKHPRSYGKWAVVTGCTGGIGKEFVEELAKQGMSILLISRTESKLKDQKAELEKLYSASGADFKARYIAYDFTDMSSTCTAFYKQLDETLLQLKEDGGVGILVNNVGTTKDIPYELMEFTEQEIDDMINVNIFGTIRMTRSCLRVMQQQGSGAIIGISSGSGNHVGPMLQIYSATKAFITQFIRSMHVESWGTGVDFLAVTPFYIAGTNLYTRKAGTVIAPMPIALVKGTLCQLGKKWVWQGHGYWFHGFMGTFATYWWGATERWKNMMKDNRARYEAREAEKRVAANKAK